MTLAVQSDEAVRAVRSIVSERRLDVLVVKLASLAALGCISQRHVGLNISICGAGVTATPFEQTVEVAN